MSPPVWIVASSLLLAALRFAVASRLELFGDEAFYFLCSRRLDLAYADHPFMTALWVRGGTLLLGPTPLGVRLLFLVSGLLFIGIGMLFLLTDGTAGIIAPTTVDQQADAQVAIRDLVGGVPDAVVLLAIVLLALVVAVVRLLRSRRGAGTAAERDHEEIR